MSNTFEFWYDVETTGLSVPDGACILQLAGLLVKDGEVIDTFDMKINPHSYNRDITIDEYALKINKLTDFDNYDSLEDVLKHLMHMLTVHCPNDKVKLFGYNNSTFDKYFLEDMFTDQKKSFNTYFKWKQIDVFEMTKGLQEMGLMPNTCNQKLGTVGEELGITIAGELHDALVDVKLTRDIYLKMQEKLSWK